MPAERVSMRKIRDALRLTYALGMSRRLVSEATGIGKTAVGEYVRRAAAAGLGWPIPDEIDDAELERRVFPFAGGGPGGGRRVRAPSARGGSGLADPGRDRRCRIGAAAVSVGGGRSVCGAHRSGLAVPPYGDEATRRDAGAALARVSRPAYPRLRLQLVLRAV